MIQKPFPLFRNQPTAGPPPPLVGAIVIRPLASTLKVAETAWLEERQPVLQPLPLLRSITPLKLGGLVWGVGVVTVPTSKVELADAWRFVPIPYGPENVPSAKPLTGAVCARNSPMMRLLPGEAAVPSSMFPKFLSYIAT